MQIIHKYILLLTVECQGSIGKNGGSAGVGNASLCNLVLMIGWAKNHQWVLHLGRDRWGAGYCMVLKCLSIDHLLVPRQKKKNHPIMEKSDTAWTERSKLTSPMRASWWWPEKNQEGLCRVLAKNTKPRSNHEETSDKFNMREYTVLQVSGGIVFFKDVHVIKNKERLWKGSRLKEIKRHN